MLNIKPPMTEFICIEGKFGNVSYYMTSLDLDQISEYLNFASEIQSNSSFSERIQRKLDRDRAIKEIYEKYLLHEGTRFFNSLVVSIFPGENDSGFYEVDALSDSVTNLKMLKIKNDTKKVVVDGQHRLLALTQAKKDIIDNHDRVKGRDDIKEMKVPVVFIIFSDIDASLTNKSIPVKNDILKETRQIFTALNKTAKKIDKNSALIIDDSDFSAVAARELLEEKIVEEDYVKWSLPTMTLNQSDPFYTTLSVIDEMIEMCVNDIDKKLDEEDLSIDSNKDVLLDKYFRGYVNKISVSPKEIVSRFFNDIEFFKEWKSELETNLNYKMPQQPIETLEITPAIKKSIGLLRDKSLLAQVVGQKALFGAILLSVSNLGITPNERMDEVFKRINALYNLKLFNKNKDVWNEVIVTRTATNTKMITRNQNVNFAKEMLEAILLLDKDKAKEVADEMTKHLGIKSKFAHISEAIDELRNELEDNLLKQR